MATDQQCRCPPKKSLGERYSEALTTDPLKTKTTTASKKNSCCTRTTHSPTHSHHYLLRLLHLSRYCQPKSSCPCSFFSLSQAFILSICSATISQLTTNGGKFTPEVMANASKMALLSCPPYSHFWYPILDKISSNPVIKTIIDQLFWRPLLIAYTFVLMNLLKVRLLFS